VSGGLNNRGAQQKRLADPATYRHEAESGQENQEGEDDD
jgi:hypothetical protein